MENEYYMDAKYVLYITLYSYTIFRDFCHKR